MPSLWHETKVRGGGGGGSGETGQVGSGLNLGSGSTRLALDLGVPRCGSRRLVIQ